jgi:hypothetical protein
MTLMSEHEQEALLDIIPGLVKLVPLVKSLLAGACVLAIWVTTIELRTHAVSKHENDLQEMKLWKASTDASRYTSSDANKMLHTITESLSAQDKRVQRLEDAHTSIIQTLSRIEKKLDP